MSHLITYMKQDCLVPKKLCLTVKNLFNTCNSGLRHGHLCVQAKAGEVKQAVKTAIACGYRLVDCAYIYGNEKEVGEALAEVLNEGTVRREDLFIISKVHHFNVGMLIPGKSHSRDSKHKSQDSFESGFEPLL